MAQDRVTQWAIVMHISMKISSILQMYYSQSLKKVSDRFGVASNLEILSDVAITQKAERSHAFI
jgi:hypothetical protein